MLRLIPNSTSSSLEKNLLLLNDKNVQFRLCLKWSWTQSNQWIPRDLLTVKFKLSQAWYGKKNPNILPLLKDKNLESPSSQWFQKIPKAWWWTLAQAGVGINLPTMLQLFNNENFKVRLYLVASYTHSMLSMS